MPGDNPSSDIKHDLDGRSIVLVGMMGAGKTTVGRRLAARLKLPFIDVDAEIEKAAGQSIADIFAEYGEDHFRAGEQRVFLRLLGEGPQVLATGGGTFMNEETRAEVSKIGISVWLKAEFKTLFKRVKRRSHRPLLKTANPEQVLRDLMAERDPIYSLADITVSSREVPHDVVVGEIIAKLGERLTSTATKQASAG